MNAKISASILSCDFLHLENELKKLEGKGIDSFHLDIMDGHFVPNISFGPHVAHCIDKISNVPSEVHLMVSNPLKFIDQFPLSKTIIFHLESSDDPFDVISKIKNLKKSVGISIKPGTNIDRIVPFFKFLDLVLVMTVEPGFGGQTFMYDQVGKIENLKKIINNENLNLDIEVDGGINYETAKICAEAGASIAVAGTYIFKSDNARNSINLLKSI